MNRNWLDFLRQGDCTHDLPFYHQQHRGHRYDLCADGRYPVGPHRPGALIMPTPTAYTANEAADRADVSNRQLIRYINLGYIKAQKIDKMWVVDRQEFEKWLEAGQPRVPREESPREIAKRMMREQRASLGITA